ncbi:hypothetical protein B0H13DRAFT_2346166 [Mycena leptocephala]|nr:hypothetical protein B0H13DRAFT_2346166 [Mycena leptocephala]
MTGTKPAHARRRLLLHLDADFLSFPQPINFLSLLHLCHTPLRIMKSADQQTSIFLHQKLKVGSSSALSSSFPFLLPSFHKYNGRIVDLATNCYGYHVLQKTLDCKEEEHALENLEESAKDGIVDELLGQVGAVFSEVAKSQWGSYCIQHILEHFAMNEQGSKSVVKALKEGGKETLERVTRPSRTACCAMIVDLALSLTASHLASVLPTGDQRAALYDCIRVDIITLRGCKTGSKAI